MNSQSIKTLKETVEQGVGAEVTVQSEASGPRSGLSCHFSVLTQNQGPVCSVFPTGLKRHRVSLRFGKFSVYCITQMQLADEESLLVARALVQSIAAREKLEFSPTQALESWKITGSDFGIDVEVRNVTDPIADDAISRTARDVMVPLMAAMAELIGYDEVDGDGALPEPEDEGRITEAIVQRRERSRRNRLLCLTLHGNRCAACGVAPQESYGAAGAIIQVHHLQPLGLIAAPRAYDPRTDLVPLCPNCHSAVHTRRPVPYSIAELKELLGRAPHPNP